MASEVKVDNLNTELYFFRDWGSHQTSCSSQPLPCWPLWAFLPVQKPERYRSLCLPARIYRNSAQLQTGVCSPQWVSRQPRLSGREVPWPVSRGLWTCSRVWGDQPQGRLPLSAGICGRPLHWRLWGPQWVPDQQRLWRQSGLCWGWQRLQEVYQPLWASQVWDQHGVWGGQPRGSVSVSAGICRQPHPGPGLHQGGCSG